MTPNPIPPSMVVTDIPEDQVVDAETLSEVRQHLEIVERSGREMQVAVGAALAGFVCVLSAGFVAVWWVGGL